MKNYVTIERKKSIQALDWAKENCPGYITNDLHQDGYYTYDPDQIDFYFTKCPAGQQQMTMFALRWL